jgi:hypothetical protein
MTGTRPGRLPAGLVVWSGLADDHCGRSLPDLNEAVLGQRDQRVPTPAYTTAPNDPLGSCST